MQYTLQHAYIVACSAGHAASCSCHSNHVGETVAESILSLIIRLGRSSGSILLIKSSRKPAGKLESELVSWSEAARDLAPMLLSAAGQAEVLVTGNFRSVV